MKNELLRDELIRLETIKMRLEEEIGVELEDLAEETPDPFKGLLNEFKDFLDKIDKIRDRGIEEGTVTEDDLMETRMWNAQILYGKEG